MPEPDEQVATEKPAEPTYDPGPEFKEKVVAILKDLGVLGDKTAEPEPEPERPKGRRTLRDEEDAMERLVNKVIDKLPKEKPEAAPAKPEPERPPGPQPKKKRVPSALWG